MKKDKLQQEEIMPLWLLHSGGSESKVPMGSETNWISAKSPQLSSGTEAPGAEGSSAAN